MTRIWRRLLMVCVLLAAMLLSACSTTEGTYRRAQTLMARGEYAVAADLFGGLGSYEESSTLAMYCRACAAAEEGDYQTAIATLTTMGNYKDCPLRVTYYTARALEAEAGTDGWELMQQAQEVYSAIPLFLDSTERIAALDGRIAAAQQAQYDAAVAAGERGAFLEADAGFQRLGNYSDSTLRRSYYRIRAEEAALVNSGDQDAMIATAAGYTSMGSYLDCAERAAKLTSRADATVEARYGEVEKLTEAGEYGKAAANLGAFGSYGSERIPAHYYAIGEHARSAGCWEDAILGYRKAGEFNDAGLRAVYCGVCRDEELLGQDADQDAVIAVADRFTALDGCLDSADRAAALTARADGIVKDKYAQVDALISQGEYIGAQEALTSFGKYGAGQTAEKHYAVAELALAEGQWDVASQGFELAGKYKNATKRVNEPYYLQAEALLAEGDWDGASAAFRKAGNYSNARSRINEPYYLQAETLLAQGKWSEASAAFKKAGYYKDAHARVNEPYYLQAEALMAEGKWDNASAAFKKAGSYSDAKSRINEPYYRQAEALMAAGDWDGATAAFRKAGTYSDAKSRVNEPYYRKGEALLAEGKWSEAYEAFRSVRYYSDAEQCTIYCNIRMDEAALPQEPSAEELAKLSDRYAKLGKCQDSSSRAAALKERADAVVAARFSQAETLAAEGDYAGAMSLLDNSGVYGSEGLPAVYYRVGETAQAAGSWDDAAAAFTRAGEYEDSPSRVTYCGCRKDEASLESDASPDLLIAMAVRYEAMGQYLDCADRAAALQARADDMTAGYYADVDALIGEGRFAEAADMLEAADSHGKEQAPARYYAVAAGYEAAEDWAQAAVNYQRAGTHADAADKFRQVSYRQAEALLAQGEWDESSAAFQRAGNYSDAESRIKEPYYRQGEALLAQGDEVEAFIAFRNAGDYPDARRQLYAVQAKIGLRFDAGYGHTVGVMENGSVMASANTVNAREADTAGWHSIVAIDAGEFSTIGLKADGTVVSVCRYANSFAVDSWTDIVAVATGYDFCIGLKADGTFVYAGQRGYTPPRTGYVDFALGKKHAVFLHADGTVDALGQNSSGQCNVQGWTDIVAIAAGDFHTVGLRADGRVVVAGDNSNGQCAVGGWTDIIAVAAGDCQTMGLRADGTVAVVGSRTGARKVNFSYVSSWTDIIAIAAGDGFCVGLREDGLIVTQYGVSSMDLWK